MDVHERMKKAGIILPAAPSPAGLYTPALEFGGNLVYTSGMGPQVGGMPVHTGRVGAELTLEQGQEAARVCMLNVLSVLAARIGDLNRVKRAVKILGFVASDDGFYSQPLVLNAASQVLIDVFGDEAGRAARSAIGVNVLPGNIPVEIEVLFELN